MVCLLMGKLGHLIKKPNKDYRTGVVPSLAKEDSSCQCSLQHSQ